MIEKKQSSSLGHARHQPNWQDRSFWNHVPHTGMGHQHEASYALHISFFTKNKCHLLLSSDLLFKKQAVFGFLLSFVCFCVCMWCMYKGISWVWEHISTWMYLGASCIWEPQVGFLSSYILYINSGPLTWTQNLPVQLAERASSILCAGIISRPPAQPSIHMGSRESNFYTYICITSSLTCESPPQPLFVF